jgi:hypothetical protein
MVTRTGPPLPEPWTRVRTPSEAEYPRVVVGDLHITSLLAAKGALAKVKAPEAMPYQVIIRP